MRVCITVKTLGELALEIREKSASLFLGAGSSFEAGGPTDLSLLKALTERFTIQTATKTPNTLAFIEELIYDQGESIRPEIEQFIKLYLQGIGPTDQHRYLFSIPWRAVLTTNYDSIPDLIIKTLDGNRHIIPVIDVPEKDKSIDPRRSESLYCFKLMGDYNFTHPQKGWMVLSQSDTRNSVNRRKYFFDMFSSLASTGLIVYIGYSFDDRVALQRLSDMKYELKQFPWKGYAISPIPPSSRTLERMKREFNIEWINGTLTQFVGNLRIPFGYPPKSFNIPPTPLLVNNTILNLDKSVEMSIRHKFRYLNNRLMEPVSTEPRAFFSGKETSFYPYKATYDYPRTLVVAERSMPNGTFGKVTYCKTLDLVKERQNVRPSSKNELLILTGIAGSGKTIVTNRLAYEWYQNKDPVIFVDSKDPSYDVQILENLIDEITAKYKQSSTEPEPRNPKFLIIADDCPAVLNEMIAVFKRCTADGKQADFLLVGRDSELPSRIFSNPSISKIIKLQDRISTTEIGNFADHLVRVKFVHNRSQVIPYIDDPNINSFFEMMWRAVNESKTKIESSIESEYDKLSHRAKRIYQYVSLIQAFNLEPYLSIVWKMCKEDWIWLNSELSEGYLKGVLSFDNDTGKIQCSHRIVAGIIAKYVFPTKEDAITALKGLTQAASDGNIAEMELVDELLNKRIEGRIGIARDYLFTDEQKLELYDSALEKIKTGPLLHHRGMVLRALGKLPQARENVKEAKSVHYPGFEEPESYLLDTEGRIELDEAKQAVEETEKWNHLERAQNIFEQARDSPITTPHVYQGLALTYLTEAELSDREAKFTYLLAALQQTDRFKSFLGASEHKGISISDVEQDILAMLGKFGFSESDAELVAEKFNNPNGFARLAENRIEGGQLDSETLRLIDKGLAYSMNSSWLLRLKFELLRYNDEGIKNRGPIKNRGLIIPVLSAYSNIRREQFDMKLDFELAKHRFISSDYRGAFEIFHQLSNVSHMNLSRHEMLEENRWMLGDKPMVCTGEVVEKPVGTNGLIKMVDPKGCKDLIEVRQRQFPSNAEVGNTVSFQIIFNFVGPQASRVVKVE